MEKRLCGTSGLRLSELSLGTLTWGRDTPFEEAEEMLRLFISSGGDALEVSPVYGDGLTVDVIHDLLALAGRSRVKLLLRGGSRTDKNGKLVLSSARGDMLASLDTSLKRMGTDYVDVFLAGPDPRIPLEETLSALDYAWRTGRAHYVGLSHRGVWDTASACAMAQSHGSQGERPILIEEEISLMCRADATELYRRSTDAGLGVLAHSPLAGGVLTGKYRHSTPPDSRAASQHLHSLVDRHLVPKKLGIVEAVAKAAEGMERTPSDVALTWVRDLPGISSVIVGPRTTRQLEQLLEVRDPLPRQIREVLNEVSASLA